MHWWHQWRNTQDQFRHGIALLQGCAPRAQEKVVVATDGWNEEPRDGRTCGFPPAQDKRKASVGIVCFFSILALILRMDRSEVARGDSLKPPWMEKEWMTRTAVVFSLLGSPWLPEASRQFSQVSVASPGKQFFLSSSVSECLWMLLCEPCHLFELPQIHGCVCVLSYL